MSARTAANVALRYLLAREQLAPALKHVEQSAQAGRWDEALRALEALAKAVGVFFLGSDRTSIHTEWFSGLDQGDKEEFLAFVDKLRDIRSGIQSLSRIKEQGLPNEDGTRQRWMEDLLRALEVAARDVSAIQEMMRDDTDAYTHGPFKIIPLKGVASTTEAVETLDKATALIQRKFPKVLYGKVYVRKDLRPSGTYDARPGSGELIAGSYSDTSDTITLSMYALPTRNSVMTLIHEFGHRYHTRFLKGDDREKFIQLSTMGDVQEDFFRLSEREGFADEWIARSRGFRDDETFGNGGPVYLSERANTFFNGFPRDEYRAKVIPLSRRFDDGDETVVPALREALARSQFGGNLRVVQNEENLQPVYASDYGSTSWEENFAESFLAFVMGKALPEPLQRFMAAL